MLGSVAEQASVSLTWSETPEDTFSHGEAQWVCGSSSNWNSFFDFNVWFLCIRATNAEVPCIFRNIY